MSPTKSPQSRVTTNSSDGGDAINAHSSKGKDAKVKPRFVLYIVPHPLDLFKQQRERLSARARARGAVVLDKFEAPKKRKRKSQNDKHIVPTHFIISEHAKPKHTAVDVLKFKTKQDFENYVYENNIICATPKWIINATDELSEDLKMEERWWKLDLSMFEKKSSAASSGRSNGSKRSTSSGENQSDNEDDREDSNRPSKKRGRNLAISTALHELSKLHQKCALSAEDDWKSYAFSVVAGRVRHLDFEITLEEESQKRLSAVKGIGKRTQEKINEFLRYGEIQRTRHFKKYDPQRQAMYNLNKIWGVGRSKALELMRSNCANIGDVREKLSKNEIELNRNQRIGVECYEDFQEEMNRDEVEKISQIIEKAVIRHFSSGDQDKIEFTVMGSYRRGKESCGDVDVVITHKDFDKVVPSQALGEIVEDLMDEQYMAYHLTFVSGMRHRKEHEYNIGGYNKIGSPAKSKPEKLTGSSYMGVFHSPVHAGKRRRVDIKFYPYRERVFASLYFTGNGYANRSMRLYADRKYNLHLNDHGLFDKGRQKRVLEAETEKEVFDYLGLQYKTPEERDCFDSIVSKDGGDPLVELAEVSQRDFEREESKHPWIE